MTTPTYMHLVDGVPTQISYHNVKKLHPKTSFPHASTDIPVGLLEDLGYQDLHVDPPAVPSVTQKLQYQTPILENGVWVMRNILVNKIGQELEDSKELVAVQIEKDARVKGWSGFVHNGTRYDTDPNGVARIDSGLVRVGRNPGASFQWKAEDAVTGKRKYVNFNSTKLNSLADAVDAFLDVVSAAEEAALAKIEAGDFTADFQTEYDILTAPEA